MQGREQLRYAEMRVYLYNRAGGRCEVCRKRISVGKMQIAHRIPQTKDNVKKYGKQFIHHRFNLAATCSLDCNAKVDIRNHPVAISDLEKRIKEDLDA